jgi:predicted SAM-dependent methyltransferase
MSVKCLCNDEEISSFKDFNSRQNAMCPSCTSLERHRSVMLFFKKHNMSFSKMLHFAPEHQLSSLFNTFTSKYVRADLTPWSDNVVRMDITQIPYSCEFDCIFSSHVLEHIIEDRLAMREIYKALKPGGTFIALIPQKFTQENTYEDSTITSAEDRQVHFGQWDHVRWYGLDFTKRLKEAGFHIRVNYPEGTEDCVNKMVHDEKRLLCSKADMRTYSLLSTDLIYECIKL